MESSQLTPLSDKFGRVIRDLRISVTDRCNFRCVYCMPAEGLEWKGRDEILCYEEIVRLTRLLARLGVRKTRVTGGEPLLRRDVEHLIAALVAIPGIEDVAMTTNGFLLPPKLEALRAAGLQRLNVSLDSLREDRFRELTRTAHLGRVLEAIGVAAGAGFRSVKVNMVVMAGVNDDEIADFARFGRNVGVEVRFIEFMPLDGDHAWDKTLVFPGSEVLRRIAAVFPIEPAERAASSDTAMRWRYTDGGGAFGVIASVTAPFCGRCVRLRLTADGQLRTCLFSQSEHGVRDLLRGGISDDLLIDTLRGVVLTKEAGHRINEPDFVQPARTMSCIGG